MSDDPKPLDLSDLSGLSLAPAWVSELGTPGSPQPKEYTEFDERPGRDGRRGGGRRDGGGGGGRRDDRRGGGGRGDGGQRRDDNRGRGDGPRRDDRRGGGGGPGRGGQDRRDGRGRDDRRGGPGGRGRDRDSRFGDRPPHQEEKPPEGIAVDVQPIPTGLESLAAWIRSSGRSTSVYDLAKAMLRRRELYQIRFRRTAENAPKLIQCVADGTLWTTREAAIGHWIQAGAPGDFYAKETVEVEPPKGNFTAIAVCGMSGTLLGPPNHHTYQTNLHRLHRERFSNIPIDRYKSRITVEHNEEIVEKWRSQNSHTTQYRWLKDPDAQSKPETEIQAETSEAEQDQDGSVGVPPASPTTESEPETPTAESAEPPVAGGTDPEDEPENAEPSDTESEESDSPDPISQTPAQNSPDPEPAGLTLASKDDLRRHALTHHADELFTEVETATVSGAISGKQIGAPLLTALKIALEPLRRSPAPLVPGLCKELENRGLKIFRWGRALFANSARPRPLAEDANLSDRISKIVSLVREHPGIGTKRILRTLLEKPADAPPAEATPEATPDAEAEALERSGSTPLPPPPITPEQETTPSLETTPEQPAPEAETEIPAPPEPAPEQSEQPAPEPTAEAPAPPTQASAPSSPKAEKAPAPEQTPEEHAAEVAILRDLRWLVHEGYLIEFTEGKIFLATARPPAHPAKNKPGQPKKKRPPRQRKPRGKEQPPADAKPEAKVDPDAPTQKLIRDTEPGPPASNTERIPIPQEPTTAPAKQTQSAPEPTDPEPQKPAPTPTPEETVRNTDPALPSVPAEAIPTPDTKSAPKPDPEAEADRDPEPKPHSPEV